MKHCVSLLEVVVVALLTTQTTSLVPVTKGKTDKLSMIFIDYFYANRLDLF